MTPLCLVVKQYVPLLFGILSTAKSGLVSQAKGLMYTDDLRNIREEHDG